MSWSTFGLGRYGDSLDPDGHLKGLEIFIASCEVAAFFILLYLSDRTGSSLMPIAFLAFHN